MRLSWCQNKRFWLVFGLASSIVVVVFQFHYRIGQAAPTGGSATILSPARVGGATGYNNERDADTYPAAAYDVATGRYLAVWMSLRNAGSSSDGFDVYGVFLGRTGQPIGSEFRISDSNTAARNGLPTVAAGNGVFAVAWAARGTTCQIYVQRVTDTSSRSDRILVSGASHRHSPHLVYNATRQRYVVVYVEGDDYLPPTFFGAQTADCGSNVSSTSSIKAMEFYFSGESPITGTPVAVSDVSSGAFRPRLVYSAGLNQYLAAWEDRRNAGGQPYRFDVYAQRLGATLTRSESNLSLATGGDYTNYDTTAAWTPRPVVAASSSQFLAAWFTRETQDVAVIWSAMGCLVPGSGTPGTSFTIAQMPFAQSHTGQSPAGFLAAVYSSSAQEYMVGVTTYLESLWGYLSLALVQRVSNTGQLLKMDGTAQSQPGVGYSVDYENEDQVAVGMAVNPAAGCGAPDYLMLYSKHTPNKPAQDLDVWGVGVQMEDTAQNVKCAYLPLIKR
jgi:hypothetical protein